MRLRNYTNLTCSCITTSNKSDKLDQNDLFIFQISQFYYLTKLSNIFHSEYLKNLKLIAYFRFISLINYVTANLLNVNKNVSKC